MELVKAGAADYIGKPWDDRKLLTCVRNLLELSQARRALADAARVTRERRQRLAREHDLRGVIYADPASERMLALACQVARSALSVLITGPNGSGKEKITEILHANSRRRGAFVAVNCGALPAELIEAELFGAEAGAYTGANRPREGKFEAADGRPNVRCGSMHGPATCANCATRCIARVCWNRARWWMRMLSGLPPPSRHR